MCILRFLRFIYKKRKKRNNRNIRITCVIASTNTKIIIYYHLKVV